MRLKSRLIHAGWDGDPTTGAVNVPIYQVSTFKQESVGVHKGYEYARTGNPTRTVLEALIADLEGGALRTAPSCGAKVAPSSEVADLRTAPSCGAKVAPSSEVADLRTAPSCGAKVAPSSEVAVRAFAFASGLAALTTLLMRYSAGDHLILGDDLYGGTFRLQSKVFQRFNISATLVDTSNVAALKAAIRPATRAILLESPTNPLLRVTDIRAVADLAHANGIEVIVDNTFMTPYWQRPLELGADIVWHSATKYLGGHSDVVGGLVVVKEPAVGEELAFLQNAAGGVPGPQDCYLLIRGIKTLGVRMEAHESNAHRLAAWLQGHPKVQRVYYPGLAEHPGHAIQRAQAGGFGGMISFDVGEGALADQVLKRVRLFTLAESLGAVESLIELPARMTHAAIPKEHRESTGVTDGLIRLSVGIEDPDDLIEDLSAALG